MIHLEALIKHTSYLDYLFDQDYNEMITWKSSIKIPLEYELHFSASRGGFDMHKLRGILTQAVYNSPTEAAFKLLESENQIAFVLMDKIRESKIDDKITSPKDLISRNPKQFAKIISLIMGGDDTKLSEWKKKWMEMFGLTRIEKPLTSLGIGLETLKGLRDLSNKDSILEQTRWNLHFSKMTDEEYKGVFSLFEESLFLRRKENTIIYSFMQGILENFDRWYEIIIGVYYERYSNRLIAITGLIGKFKSIGNEKHKSTFIKKLQERLKLENWETIIEENRKEEDPLREVMEHLETTDHYSELIYHKQKIIEELFTKGNYFSSYFKTFLNASIFVEWLQKKIEENNKVFSPYMTEFFDQTKQLSFSLEPTSYHGRIGGILTFLRSKTLVLPKIQELITKNDFFRQLREFMLVEVQENSYNLQYIPYILAELKKLNQLGMIDRKVYIQEILEEINLEALLLTEDNRYRLRRFIEPKKENEEFIEILVNTERFKSLNWTKIASETERVRWYEFYSFIDDLKNYPTILTDGILSNPTFWSIKWNEFINEWLISYDKRLVNFINFLERFRENKSVRGFILSSELIKCPWEHCYQKITQQEKENSSRLTYNEFEKILIFLSSINPDFHKLMINIGIKLENNKKTEEE